MGYRKPPQGRPACPFYGFTPDGYFLMDSGSNHCGLAAPMLSPCRMERAGLAPDSSRCEINPLGQERWKELLKEYIVFPEELQPEEGGATGVPFPMWADMVKGKEA